MNEQPQKLCWRKRSPFIASRVNLLLSSVCCEFKENILWILALWLYMQKKNTDIFKQVRNAVRITALLEVFNPRLTDRHLKLAFWALSTKVFMLHGSSKHFTHASSHITSRFLKYFTVQWPSSKERMSLKFIQWKQSNSLKETVQFCKYWKHTLRKKTPSFINRSTSVSSPAFFPLLRTSFLCFQ
jgi:hypothetical protein